MPRNLCCWIFVVPVLALGCGQGTLPPKANPELARDTLIVALDALKKGESAESLARLDPPIYFNDLKPDVRLVDYTILDGHEWYGQSVRISVLLTLKLSDGSTKERKISYLIDTSPARVIVPG